MKQLAVIVVALLITALIGGVAGWVLGTRSADKGIIAQQKKDAQSVLEIANKQKERDKYAERVKTVIRDVPTDDCIDRKLAPAFVNGMRSGFGK